MNDFLTILEQHWLGVLFLLFLIRELFWLLRSRPTKSSSRLSGEQLL
jgi:hypothetical protein